MLTAECKKSAAGVTFVKLSTRSHSKKAFARAVEAYRSRVRTERLASKNDKWIALNEEVTKSVAVSSAKQAIELFLDSERVFQDLEYALKGPPSLSNTGCEGEGKDWNISLVARAWDPRLTPASEFRAICWDGKLTCLGQYFHPLWFPELAAKKSRIEQDIRTTMASPGVTKAIARLGGHCIVDLAWLGDGEVVIIELNPFDGVCLGTFPASTGLFLWDDQHDRAIMTGIKPFEFRIRHRPLDENEIIHQANPEWYRLIKGE